MHGCSWQSASYEGRAGSLATARLTTTPACRRAKRSSSAPATFPWPGPKHAAAATHVRKGMATGCGTADRGAPHIEIGAPEPRHEHPQLLILLHLAPHVLHRQRMGPLACLDGRTCCAQASSTQPRAPPTVAHGESTLGRVVVARTYCRPHLCVYLAYTHDFQQACRHARYGSLHGVWNRVWNHNADTPYMHTGPHGQSTS